MRVLPSLLAGVVAPVLALLPAAVQADTIFTANLTGSQEVPPALNPTTSTGAPRPLASGNAEFRLNDARTALSWTATIFNIDVTGSQTPDVNDNLVAAHIHAPAPPGANAGVVWGFFGAPLNDTDPRQLVLIPFGNGVGGTFSSVWDLLEGNNTTLTAQIPNLLNNLAYINFHTVQFTGGEIRGQILKVPLPASLALVGAGLLALGATARRRG